MFVEILKEVGYLMVYFGKWYLGMLLVCYLEKLIFLDYGFDYWFVIFNNVKFSYCNFDNFFWDGWFVGCL